MRWKFILKIIGVLIFFFGLTMVFPLIIGLYYHEQDVTAFLKPGSNVIAVSRSVRQ